MAAYNPAYSATYYAANREKDNAASSAWYGTHKEERAVYMTSYREINKATMAAREAVWKKANPERVRAQAARRRVRVAINMDKFDIELSWAYRLAIANDLCFYCGGPGENDEHYVPLAKGGTDHWWNIVRSCGECNSRKHIMDGDEFVRLVKQ